jgi:hypothetical protein
MGLPKVMNLMGVPTKRFKHSFNFPQRVVAKGDEIQWGSLRATIICQGHLSITPEVSFPRWISKRKGH